MCLLNSTTLWSAVLFLSVLQVCQSFTPAVADGIIHNDESLVSNLIMTPSKSGGWWPRKRTFQPSGRFNLPTLFSAKLATLPPATFKTNKKEFAKGKSRNVKKICGRRIFRDAKIDGGKAAPVGAWPWQISLRKKNGTIYSHICGATLVNENWVITAAHCVDDLPPTNLLLRIGNQNLLRDDEPNKYKERRVQKKVLHPEYKKYVWENDLALLQLDKPVQFEHNIIPVCLPETNSSFVGKQAYVTGWGAISEHGPLADVLQEVVVPVMSNAECEKMYRSAGLYERIPNMFLCAGYQKGGFDPCEGDSGGPMVIQREDGRWILAGITSWGEGCAKPNQPGVYTRVTEFTDWINQFIQF